MNLTIFVVREESFLALALASGSLVLGLAAAIFNAIFAFALGNSLTAIQLFAFFALAANALALCGLAVLISRYIPQLKCRSRAWPSAFFWRFLTMAVISAVLAATLSVATLLWAAVRAANLPPTIAGQRSRTMVITWFVLWAASVILEAGAFAFSAWWTKRVLAHRRLAAMDLGLGARPSRMEAAPPRTPLQASVWHLSDPDRTRFHPPNRPPILPEKPKALRLSRAEPPADLASSQTRLVYSAPSSQHSTRSSSEYSPAEPPSLDPHPFDSWDTSDLDREMRTTLHSKRRITKLDLEPIPGSRPESPATTLDGPFLPPSPPGLPLEAGRRVDRSGEAARSPRAPSFSPPASPPNSVRARPPSKPGSPTGRGPIGSTSVSPDPSETLIHPLFRASSPHPAPVAMAGTIVVACPLAGNTITPHTLTRIRSCSGPLPPRQWTRPDTALSVDPLLRRSPSPGSPDSPGSPGPSIVDDADANAAIPQFVLTAGQRRSLLGYGKHRSLMSKSPSFKASFPKR